VLTVQGVSYLFLLLLTGYQGVDHGDKGDFAKECGAKMFFDVTQYASNEDLVKAIKEATPDGLGAAAAIVCTASNEAYATALQVLRFAGTLVCVGVPEGKQVPIATADPTSLISKEIRIVGSLVGNRQDAIDTLSLAAKEVVKTRFRVEPMSNLQQVFDQMDNMELKGRVVLDLTS
jgi:propanol-preferring alcohol dehydrogenase